MAVHNTFAGHTRTTPHTTNKHEHYTLKKEEIDKGVRDRQVVLILQVSKQKKKRGKKKPKD